MNPSFQWVDPNLRTKRSNNNKSNIYFDIIDSPQRHIPPHLRKNNTEFANNINKNGFPKKEKSIEYGYGNNNNNNEAKNRFIPVDHLSGSSCTVVGRLSENNNNNINNNNNTNLPPLPPYPNEEDHVIPEELHDKLLLLNQYDNYGERKDGPVINWETNPSSQFIYSLLLDRGMMLPYHSNLLDYHMSGPFLEYISILMRGNYFVRYKRQNSAPKERFFRIIMDIDDNINNNINNN
eukprot:Tbor_TRINITY_DN1879_c0_g1::TRINITY_DN1879_c0_g1_i1::g.23079::m.23079